MTKVTFTAVLGSQRPGKPAPRLPMPEATDGPPFSRTAQLLALAHKVRRLLDEGVLRDQAEAAARLGWSFPQLTRVLGLTYLAPNIQERILSGELVVSENRLRTVCAVAAWKQQRAPIETGRQHGRRALR